MKNFLVSVSFVVLSFEVIAAQAVKVSDQDAVLLFRYVSGAGVSTIQDTQNEILHAELMMCSFLLPPTLGKKLARCLLPEEKVKIDKDNAVEITDILKSYNMPSNYQLGYQTFQAGLDCVQDLAGQNLPRCLLIPKP